VPYSHLTTAIQNGTAIVTLHRPAQRNALSLALMRELIECLSELEQNTEARAIILAAAGPAFCAGHDLRELTGLGADAYREIFAACTEMMTKIQSVPQPVIAEVQGMATAAGCQLVATCDLAIASERATFATPGVRIGLFCSTPMVAVSRVLGRKRALEMLLTGDAINACTAAEWGLVNRVVPEAELRTATLALAERIGHASAFTIKTGKQAFYRQADLPQAEAYAFTQEVMTENALAADAQEGICAFLEKRTPRWQGR
jgi:enoyl-CoA hydratase/carnithine racemase